MSTKGKRIAIGTAGLLLSPVVLLLLCAFLVYLPPVQRWGIDKICAYASEQSGVEVRIERFRLSPLLDLDLQGIVATNPDTLLAVRHCLVDLDFSHVLSGHIGVEAIDLEEGAFHSRDFIATTQLQGRVGQFHLAAADVDWKGKTVHLSAAALHNSSVDIAMRDTMVVDTAESRPLPWRLLIDDVWLTRSSVVFHQPGDSLRVGGEIDTLRLTNGDVNLAEGCYSVARAAVRCNVLQYDQSFEPFTDGLDYKHLKASAVNLIAEQVLYVEEGNRISAHILQGQAREQSGLELCGLSGSLQLDEQQLTVSDLSLATPHSHLSGDAQFSWSALTENAGGHMKASLKAAVAKADVALFVPAYADYLPKNGLTADLSLSGNVDTLHVDAQHLLIEPMLAARATGTLYHLLDLARLSADLEWEAESFDLSELHKMLNLPSSVQLPKMKIAGKAKKVGETYIADLRLQQAGGVAAVKGTFNAATENYEAKIDVRNLNLHNFLPQDSLYNITAHAEVSGGGLDFQSPSARCDGTVLIEHLRYGHNDFRNVRLNGKLRNGKGYVDFYSDNDLLQIQACAEVALDRKNVTLSDFSLDASRLDLHRLGLVPKPLVASMLMHLEGSSDFVDTHRVKGRVQAIQLALRDTIVHPVDMDVEALLLPDSLYVLAHAGDLELRATAPDSWKQVLEKVTEVTEEITRQYSEREIDPLLVRSLLPVADVHIESGPNNPMGNFLKSVYGYSFDRLHLDVTTSPTLGVNGDGTLLTVNTGSVQLDTIQCRLYHDENDDFRIFARVKNGPKNKQVVFDSNVRAQFTPSGASAQLQFFDARGVKGVDMGAVVNLEEEGMRLHLHPLQPVIAYRNFSLNDDNFVFLRRDRHLEANIDLIADDGTGFKLYTSPNETALQDITLSVHDFNVGELSDVIPYMPDVRGTLAGDFHYVQDEGSMSVSVDAQVVQMMYEGAQLGNIGLNATYLPNSDGTHYVDGIVSHNGNDVLLLTGTYNPAGQGTLDGQAELQRLPLELANGFLPDNLATLAGYVHGQLDVSGSVASPVLDGALRTDSMRLNSDLYSVHLRFPDDTIRIEKSIIDLNHLQAYSKGKSPVVLDGRIDARKTEKIGLDVSLKAHDFELINAPKTRGALAYGRVYVDIDTRLTGTLDNLKLRGALNVLGNTNVTYVLTDSPLTVDDQLADLVTFVDFSDTTYVEPERLRSAQNIDMLVDIGIKQSAQVHCLLSADGTNYVDIEGGGDLTMKYTTRDNLQLFGRYVVTSGKMNYTLIVTALKDMEIKSGSYVEWTGDIANPRLSLQASEHVKTTVYENNVPRSVNFNVGIVVSKTLADMGLEFTLEAPEDLNITNQLTTMSSDARGKVAVTMLATGMYLAEEAGTSGFSGTNALNAFLQNQVSVISSKALKTIDMNFGIDNTNTASGAVKTDYNFSFAKRFWGNRISLIIGGKVSSGANVQNTGQSIIDNVSLEYRLDKSATRFVRLYYDRDTKSLLENEVMEMGAGVVFRKKSTRLGELFIFRKKE